MHHAQEAANSQDKSTAGDKHETAKAMGQIDAEMNGRQLEEALRELKSIEGCMIEQIHETFVNGSVAVCNAQVYFMLAGLGKLDVANKQVIFISAKAPLSKAMYGKRAGEEVVFNGNRFLLSEVY